MPLLIRNILLLHLVYLLSHIMNQFPIPLTFIDIYQFLLSFTYTLNDQITHYLDIHWLSILTLLIVI